MEGRRWLREVMGLNVTNVANEQIHSAAIEYSSFSIICEAQSRKNFGARVCIIGKLKSALTGLLPYFAMNF